MNLSNVQLHTLLPDGTERMVRLVNMASPMDGANLLSTPLVVKVEGGAKYKLINIETGAHQKGQSLVRHNKDLKVFIDDVLAIELKDYFVASLSPTENSAIYQLENASCNEVQVTSNYPLETFQIPESLTWTENDSALDCKVALFNPGSVVGLIPGAAPVLSTSFGFGQIAATVIGIPVLLGGVGGVGGSGSPTPPPPPAPSPGPIDTSSPSLVITTNASSAKADETILVTFTFSEDIGNSFNWDGTSGDIVVTGGTLSALSGSGLVRTAIFTPTPNQTSSSAGILVKPGSYQDASGNLGLGTSSPSLSVDTTFPKLISTEITSAKDGLPSLSNANIQWLNSGDTLFASATFNETVFLDQSNGSPTIELLIGDQTVFATYASGSGTNTLIFSTTVINGQSDTDGVSITLNALQLNGATVQDIAGNQSLISSSSVISNPNFLIDTIFPEVVVSSDVATLKIDETATITFTFTEDPGSSFSWNGTDGNLIVSGGTLSAINGTGITRTAVFTPTMALSSSSASITVTSASYFDSAGNPGSTGSTPSITIDTLAPSVVITSDVAALKASETAAISFSFSEDPGLSFIWDGTAGDLIVTGGTLSAIEGTGLTRLATFTPTASQLNRSARSSDTFASITVSSASYSDAAGNTGSAGLSPSITIDTLEPSVSIASDVEALKNGETAVITFSFSEDPGTSFVWSGTEGDLTVSGGSLGTISGTGLTRTAVFTPTANLSSGSASITVTSSGYADAAGNTGSAGTSPSITIDTLSPTVNITSDVTTLKVGETATITFTFSEDPVTSFSWDGTAGDLIISGGTLSAISGTGLTRTATFTPTPNLSNGSASISVASASYSDAAGNTGSAGNSSSVTIDTLAPTVSITSNVAALKVGETASITFTFSEDPGTGFAWNGTSGDLTVLGGTLSAISGTGLTRTGTFTPTANLSSGTASITVTSASYSDAEGNTGSAGTSPSITIDTLAPTIAITSNVATLKVGETATITFTFSEDLETSFAWNGTTGDLNVYGGTLDAISGTGLSRTAVFTPTANLSSGSASISVNSASYSDAAGNTGSAGMSPSLTIDTLAPTVTITSDLPTLKVGETANITFTFSEDPGNSFAWNGTVGDLTVSGGSLGAISGTGLSRTAVFTPTANLSTGSASISVTSASYSDAAGNTGSGGASPSITIDTLAPTVAITSNVTTLKGGETATITFTFSEDPGNSFAWNGTAGDLTISGGTLGAIIGTGLTRTATFTPIPNLSNGSASISVTSASYSDAAGNTGSAGTSPSITIDTLAPTVTITSDMATLKVGDTAAITFTFSEDPETSFAWNGTTGDLTISGGTLSAINGTGLTRTAVFTPTANLSTGSASITVTSATYVDAAGNTGSAGASASITIDTLAPTVAITSNVATLKVGETATITFTFSEDPGTSFAWNGTTGDLTISGGTLGAISGTGLSRTGTFTPTANLSSGSASITVTSASYSDAAGNTGSAGASPSITIDTLAPTVAITSNVAALKAGQTATITFTFSEDPGISFAWNGTTGDLTISGGTLSAISGTGLTRTGTFTPNANLSSGSASIAVTSASYSDAVGNTGSAGTSPSITIDTLAPTVAITSNVATLKVGETATITFTFSEDPGTSFAWDGTVGDLTISGGTLSAISGTGLTRTATFTPTANLANSSASITVTSASYADAAGNTGSAGSSPSITIDTLSPTVTITSNATALKVGETATITFTFSEDPSSSFSWNGTDGDLTVSGGTLGTISGTGLTRTAVFTPSDNLSTGSASITVTSASYADAAGNTGSAGTSPSITIDTLAPTVAITSNVATLKVGETATITFTFSEDPGTSFAWNGTVGDLTISGGTVSAISGTGLTRTAVFTPSANLSNSSASITVTSASYSDAAGNTGSVGTSPSITIDTLAPTVNVTSDVSTLKAGQTATITFTFSEDPGTSFEWNGTAGDLTISGGTLGAISGTGLTGTGIFTPTANLSSGSASITVTSASYADAAGNTGTAGTSPSITIDTLTPTIAITSNVSTLKVGETVTITFTFSEDPGTSFAWNGTTGDLTISGGTLGAISGTGLTRTAVFTPTANLSSGSASITVTSASYTDTAGNIGSAGTTPSITIDTLAPTVTITSNVAALKAGQTAVITFIFSEDPGTSFVWNGTVGDLTVSGGSLGAISGTGLTRSAIFTPSTDVSIGSASISISNASYSDAAGNTGTGGSSPSIVINTLGPTVAITSNVAALKAGETATITFTFSDDPELSFEWNGTSGDLTVLGGTLGAITGSGLTRTAVFTPTANLSSSTASITVTSASYTDTAGNTGSAGASPTITIDTLSPTVTITSDMATLKIGETANITFTFSEDPGPSFSWNGTTGDLTISGGTLGAISGTGLTRTATFTPTANLSSGSASITVTSASYSDAAGNTGSAGISPSITIDTLAPTVAITSNVAALKVGETANITFTFSEDPGTSFTWNGTTGDLTISGGTLGAINGTGLTRTAIFTPTTNQNNGSASITLTSASYSDAAGNTGSAGTSPSITIDTLAPTVAITSNVAALKAGQTATITFTFSEDPGISFAWNGTTGDLTISGGTLSAISGTGLTRTGTFTPTANLSSGSASITVTSASYSDTAGNTGSAGLSPSISIDTLAPTVAITSNVATLKVGETATITFTFSKDPGTSFAWNGTTGDLTISGGTLGAISGTGLTRTGTFTPTANLSSGSASITVTSASYSDTAGNTGSAGTSPSITIDTLAPTVAITSNVATLKFGETATITFTFSEDPGTSFAWNGTSGDLTVSGGSLGTISGTGLTRTAVFTPTANKNSDSASITVTSASYSDTAGNTGSAGTSPSITIDTLGPTVAITSNLATLKVGEIATITFTFSEDPGTSFAWNGTTGDLTISGGTLGAISGTGLTRTAVFTPSANLSSGSASITVTSASYSDAAGNTGSADTSPTITIDTLAPTVSLTSNVSTLKVGQTATITFTFSEDPGTSFAWNGTTGDLTISGGALGAISGTGLSRTAVFTPTANLSSGSAIITVTSASYSDAAGNTGSAGTSPSITIDTLAPTVAITSNLAALKAGQTATITFTFSEDPGTSFAWNGTVGDLTISGGTLSAISGTGLTRTATFTPTANQNSGSASITVTSASYADAAGNTGSAGSTPSLSFDTLTPTISSIALTSSTGISNLYLNQGDTANISVTFNEVVNLNLTGGSPTLALLIGTATVQATYVFGTGSNTLMFTTTIAAGQNDIDGIAIASNALSLNGAIVSDPAGNVATISSLAVASNASYLVDTTSPNISSMNISGASGIINNTLNAGDVVQITANFSESITVNATGAKPRILLDIGGVSKYADYLSGSGTSDLMFGYTIAAGDTDTSGLSYATNALQLNGGTIKDSAGNNATITAIARSDNASYKVDTTSPSVVISSNVSTVGMGQTANITFTFSEDPGSSFTTDDAVVTQGTLSAISGAGLTRTAVFTPFADTSLTAVSITVPAASYTDTAGNAGLAGTSPSLSVNTFKNAIYLDDIANNIGGYAIESPNTNAHFGFSVSLVGDFNGDGYGDVVIGAPLNTLNDNGTVRTESGAAVIYEGGLNTQKVSAGYSGTGQVNGRYLYYNVNQGWLGYSVAGVGDMNNDGLADVLIGMPQDPDTQNLAGAYLVYGKANNATGSIAEYQKDITKLGAGSGLAITYPSGAGVTYRSSAGFSVSSAGDVNGDGWADMMISAVYQFVPGLLGYTGVTYVIFGSAALASSQSISLTNVGTSVAGFVISGWQQGEKSGTSVSSAGDFNGDGKADLLVSAHLNSTGGQYAGATYVILGKSNNTAVDLANINNNSGGFVIIGENSNDFSGITVSGGGDINGDGLGDLIVGAVIKDETSTTHPGKTYIVFGRTTGNATIDLGQLGATGGFTIVSTDAKDSSGFNVSSAGDINGDGLADILLGARQRTESSVLRVGQSYVVYGKSSATQVNLTDVANNQGGFAIVGQGTADRTGHSVSAAGDVNGDGLADLIVGAYGYDAASSSVVETGRAYIIFGSKGGPFAAGTSVDNAGTSANDTLTSTGSQTLVGGSFSAGTGNDTFIANGADVLLGGMGQDIFTVNSSMITALQNKFGAGGNTNQLAKIDGDAGIDTIRMGGTGGLNLDFSLISNAAVGNIEGASRINSIERIDLRTDTAANQITLRVADVLDMADSNWANLSALNTLGGDGWQNWTGSLFGASGVKYHQVAIEGTSADRVNTSGWTLQAGTVKDANSIIYDVYIAANNAPAMMLVEQNITRFSVP